MDSSNSERACSYIFIHSSLKVPVFLNAYVVQTVYDTLTSQHLPISTTRDVNCISIKRDFVRVMYRETYYTSIF